MSEENINVITGKRFTLQQQAFFKTEAATNAVAQLNLMINNPAFNTDASYSSSSLDGTSFVDKHMIYLSEHPKLNINHYLANLRLKTRLRV